MSMQFSALAEQVKADGFVSLEEIQALRQLGWGDGKIYREEAEAIFAINNDIRDPSKDWVDFFVEALSEFVLNGADPKGLCDDAEARWLIDAIDHDGVLESMAEMELLVRVVEKAQNVPELLKHYALKQIEQEVLTGVGPLRSGEQLCDASISKGECQILRRIIFASGGHGPAAVSRYDAEMLFRIKDSTLGHDNSNEWQQLFVDGVANYLQGFFHANAQLDHARQKELEDFIADNTASVGRFFGQMAKEMPHVHNHFGKVFGRKAERGGFRSKMVEGDLVTAEEADWLDEMIDADGMVDPLERALLERVKQDGAKS